jgi:putative methyltransferase (TIGR04325 family)
MIAIKDPKVFARAILSPIIGHRKVKSWEIAIKKSSGWSSERTLKHEKQFQFKQLMNEIESDFVHDERFMQLATAFFSIERKTPTNESPTISVLDVGGGFGKYFYLFSKFFPNITWAWVVVETESQCQSIPAQLKNTPGVTFCSEIPNNRKFDIGLLSSVIEYVEKPFELLNHVSEICETIVLNRIPLTPFKEDIVAIQRPGIFETRGSYPLHMFSEETFINRLNDLGKMPLRWFVPQDSPVVRFHHFPEQGMVFIPKRNTSV